MKTALAIRHVPFEGLGTFESILNDQKFKIEYLDIATQGISKLRSEDFDLVVSLGGPISVNDRNVFPFIADEINFLKQRLDNDLPTLGICLGAQMIASALGAKIYSSKVKEIGWQPLKLTSDGERTCLNFLNSKNTSMFHWHGETFDLPKGATLLASTPEVPHQAFSWKKNTLALQFHPEVNFKLLEQWYVGHISELMAANVDIFSLRKDSEENGPALNKHSNLFLSDWLK